MVEVVDDVVDGEVGDEAAVSGVLGDEVWRKWDRELFVNENIRKFTD